MKFGVSSYSYSQYMGQGRLDHLSVISKAREMGFEAIEFTDLPGETYREREILALQIKEEAARCGIVLSAYACGGNLYLEPNARAAEIARLKEQIDLAHTMGMQLFRYDVLWKLPMHTCLEEVLDIVVPAMQELAAYGEALGVRTMIENHGQAFQDYDRIEKVYRAVNHKNFGLLLDIGNFLCADQDNVFCVSRLAHLAFHIHLKDFRFIDYYSSESREHCFCTRARNHLLGTAVGSGDARVAQILDILNSIGYDGWLDIEFEGPGDCIEELARGLAFCRSLETDRVQ